MIVKLLTEHHLKFLSSKEATQSRLNLHLSKCHIVGNLMSRLSYDVRSVRLLTSIQTNSCDFHFAFKVYNYNDLLII